MATQVMKVGIMAREQYIQRTLAIARGKYRPGRDEPSIWFESLKSLAEVLSERNQALLELIQARKPRSLKVLERLTGRSVSNLSRTLKTLERHGLVELRREQKRLVPRVTATHFQVDVEIGPQRLTS
ncbi:MAG: helix-turn-helix domain-containing protein [Nitrococcus sp.]|nr:helix-turn-helix domain-containing protein [Nitrococcus sp.]